MLASCRPHPNWIPRKPKLMLKICQKLKRGFCITSPPQICARPLNVPHRRAVPLDVRKVSDLPARTRMSWGLCHPNSQFEGAARFIAAFSEGHRPSAHRTAQPEARPSLLSADSLSRVETD